MAFKQFTKNNTLGLKLPIVFVIFMKFMLYHEMAEHIVYKDTGTVKLDYS